MRYTDRFPLSADHSAASHQQYPSAYSNYADPYGQANPANPSGFNTDVYNSTAYMGGVTGTRSPPPNTQTPPNAYGAATYQAQPQAQRQYTLGGDGYGSNVLPDHNQPSTAAFDPYAPYYPPNTTTSPSPHTPHSPHSGYSPHSHGATPPMPTAQTPTAVVGSTSLGVATSPNAIRSSVATLPMPSNMPQEQPQYEDSPPMYDAATAQPPGQWGAKQ